MAHRATACSDGGNVSSTLVPRVALVTGAASGIGRGIAQHFAALGHAVAIVDRHEAAANGVAENILDQGGTAVSVTADVADENSVDLALAEIVDRLGPVGILVNNAGFARDDMVAEMSTTDWDDVVGTHLRGTFLFSRAVLGAMRATRWGRIVNISSISALAHSGRANYVAAKAGVEAFTKALAHEVACDGITANAVGPGVVVTGMTEVGARRLGRSLEEHVEALRETVPVGRVGTPADVSRAVAFFTHDDADFVTGQVVYVSGGPHG
jgi:3-oxoacyl-[acyl-carrier protein] reductase